MHWKHLEVKKYFFFKSSNDSFFWDLDNFKANAYAVFLLLIAYMAIVSILLVNLLIAMFRYERVREILSKLPMKFVLVTHSIVFKTIQIVSGNFNVIH
jgi:hypothetical protein